MKKNVSILALVITAVVALVFGSFGTAVAGGAITKGAVKKIAAKVVDKKAGTLTVAKANTATTAATATNATNLNGLGAASYQDKIAFNIDQTPSPGKLIAANAGPDPVETSLVTTSITVPAGVGFLHASGRASFLATTASAFNGRIYVSIDGPCALAGATHGANVLASQTGSALSAVATDDVVAVSPGTHTAALCVIQGPSGAGGALQSAITVQTVTGGTTAP